METIQIKDDVLKDIEKSDNLIKIKKLLLCASRNKWENDQKTLEAIDLTTLIQEVGELAPTYGQLTSVLLQVVKKLNKKVPYFLLANTLCQKLSKLYPDTQATRKRIRTQLKQLKKGVKYPYDLYDLKFTVARESSIRRGKIVIFSTINFKFGYSTQDWASLDSLEFDDLVRALFYSCETPEDLEFRLYGTAICLDEPEKQVLTAKIIVDCMLPYYQYLQRGRDITQDADEDEITAIDLDGRFAQPENFSLPEPHKSLEDETWNFGYFNLAEEMPILIDNEADGTVSETIKKQLDLEGNVKELISKYAEEVREVLEKNAQALETYLEENLESSQVHQYLPLKYKILRSLVKESQFQTSKYLEILQKLEESESKEVN
jgi:hypothetical protein